MMLLGKSLPVKDLCGFFFFFAGGVVCFKKACFDNPTSYVDGQMGLLPGIQAGGGGVHAEGERRKSFKRGK